MTNQFPIRMKGQSRLLEIGQTQIGDKRVVGIIKDLYLETEEYLKFYLKHEDKVYFDSKLQVIKMLFETASQADKPAKGNQKLSFTIVSKNLFTLFMSKVKKMNFLQLQLIEFDSFNEPAIDQRKMRVRKTLRQMQPKTQVYDVFSTGSKSLGWGATKKVTKKLSLEPSGHVTILWETEDGRDGAFSLSDVN